MNKKLVISIILLIISVLLIVLSPSIELLILFSIIGVILSIISLILNLFVRKENGKDVVSTLSYIFGIIVLLFCLIEFIATIMMINPSLNDPLCRRDDMVNNCIKKSNKISNCKYMDDVDISCRNDILENNQFK